MKTQKQIEEQLLRYMQGKGTAEERGDTENWLREHVAEPEYDAMFRRLLDAAPAEPTHRLCSASAGVSKCCLPQHPTKQTVVRGVCCASRVSPPRPP